MAMGLVFFFFFVLCLSARRIFPVRGLERKLLLSFWGEERFITEEGQGFELVGEKEASWEVWIVACFEIFVFIFISGFGGSGLVC